MSAVVYFMIVTPYLKARALLDREDTVEPTPVTEDVALLTEIRDLLAARSTGR